MNHAQVKKTYEATRVRTKGSLNLNFFCHEPPDYDEAKNQKALELLKPHYERSGLDVLEDLKPLHHPFDQEMLALILSLKPQVVSFHFGLPPFDAVSPLKAQGITVFSSATTPQEARFLEEKGVDGVIAQGVEAGGHQGFFLEDKSAEIGLVALLPQIADAVDLPVIAAGGIADGRGIAAAMCLGASGVQLGTAFLTTTECEIAPVYRNALLNAKAGETRLTRAFSGRQARGIKNHYMNNLEAYEDQLPDFPLMNTATGPLRKDSAAKNSPDYVTLWSGQAGPLNAELSIKELTNKLIEETNKILGDKI